MTDTLPPLPERPWSQFCTKCGTGGQCEKPDHPERGVSCLNPSCGYMAFVSQDPGHSDEVMQAYARTAVSAALQAQAGEVEGLKKALNAMLTHMGMDEDEWNKPTFDQARAALKEAAP